MDYTQYLTETAKSRTNSPIRSLMSLMEIPGMISLAPGSPSPDGFPFESATLKLKDGTSITIDQKLMEAALQYGPTIGMTPLVQWLRNLQEREHSPPLPDWQVIVTTGSQDAIAKTWDMLITRGDSLLLEEPSYPGAMAVLRPLGPNLIGVPTDKEGMVPEALAEILANWEQLHPTLRKPKLLYTVPTGHNPSGSTIPVARREVIYRIAQSHNLLIIEDDPYFFLQLDGPIGPEGIRRPPKSFMSMDVDGRVLRFDSLSKVISAGLRLGFALSSFTCVYFWPQPGCSHCTHKQLGGGGLVPPLESSAGSLQREARPLHRVCGAAPHWPCRMDGSPGWHVCVAEAARDRGLEGAY